MSDRAALVCLHMGLRLRVSNQPDASLAGRPLHRHTLSDPSDSSECDRVDPPSTRRKHNHSVHPDAHDPHPHPHPPPDPDDSDDLDDLDDFADCEDDSPAGFAVPDFAHSTSVYNAWLASRALDDPSSSPPTPLRLAPGMHRAFNRANLQHAIAISRESIYILAKLFWGIHPVRTLLLVFLNIVRGVLPAFRGFSQALIVDEIQTLITSGHFTWSRLSRLVLSEALRMILESLFESFASHNENIVHSSAQFMVERQQMAQRLRLDVPTLADPTVRDLLHESDLFVRSFSGMSGFGLLSPFEFIRILTTFAELLSQLTIISTLTRGSGGTGSSEVVILAFTVLSCVLPLLASWVNASLSFSQAETLYTPREARAAEQQEKMRTLACSDFYKPEVTLFGLAPWIMSSWSTARRSILGIEHMSSADHGGILAWAASQLNLTDIINVLQNIPLIMVMRSTSVSLGSLALYRTSIHSLIYTVRHLVTTARMAYHGVFLMGAFCAAMTIHPVLEPSESETAEYKSCRGGGMKIEARHLYFTYPNSKEPTLKDVNFTLEAGESLAIVGYNGSGKTTLANILLRIFDFDRGELLVNGVSIRRYRPTDYHRHTTALFQGFSRFNATLRENVGVGRVERMHSTPHIERALRGAGASRMVEALPRGLRTNLSSAGGGWDSAPSFVAQVPPGMGEDIDLGHQGLSGGEWQRLAISRAFMRADQPEVDLLLFDEPSSQLDPHAQKHIFDSIGHFARPPPGAGGRRKTVVFITHRLSTARRADKIAMFENGTITEFGTHEELLRRPQSAYAALYRASV